jgi:hypothetical protein
VKGKNPFKDKRVRQAFYQAIDIESIKSRVMRNASTPTAEMVGPGVRGFQPDMNKRLPYDVEAAKKLLAEAGYPNGFEIGMNCPNDRYVNDGAICQAVAASLARIGIKVNLQTESKATYFPKILRRDTSFYLLGWTPSTTDAHDAMYSLMATPTDKGQGQFNLGWYSNPKFDELALKVQSETDDKKRNEYIREAFKIHQDDVGHIPLHQQALAWGVSNGCRSVQTARQPHVLQMDHGEAGVVDPCRERRSRRQCWRRVRSGAFSTATFGTVFAALTGAMNAAFVRRSASSAHCWPRDRTTRHPEPRTRSSWPTHACRRRGWPDGKAIQYSVRHR